MVNVTRTTVIIDGVKLTKEVENNDTVSRFIVAEKVQRSLGFSLDSSKNSTMGRGKHTGTYQKALARRS